MKPQTTQTAPTPATELNRLGLAIVVKFLPCTNSRPARWKATLTRDSKVTFSAVCSFDYSANDSGRKATALACLAKWNAYVKKDFSEQICPPLTIKSFGYLHLDTYVFFC